MLNLNHSKFTQTLWTEIQPIYGAIHQHPFLRGLTDGTLSRDRFAFYVVQDALYLGVYARALTTLAAKAPDGETLAMFSRHATDALKVEQSLHEGFVRDLGLHPEQVVATPLAPTNQAYTDFLLASTQGRPFEEGLAAVLPCYWIYQRVGQELLPQGSPEPLYQRWIETYGGEEFDQVVQEVLTLTDRLAPTLTDAQRQAMRRRFVLASRYEWMFWNMAFELEHWPVG